MLPKPLPFTQKFYVEDHWSSIGVFANSGQMCSECGVNPGHHTVMEVSYTPRAVCDVLTAAVNRLGREGTFSEHLTENSARATCAGNLLDVSDFFVLCCSCWASYGPGIQIAGVIK